MNKLLSHRGHDMEAGAAYGDAVAYFETLRAEQERLLKSLRQAAALLDPDHGQLAALAAAHIRLTQRFFDAQRGLLRQRASVDAEIALLRSDVEADAVRVARAAASLRDAGAVGEVSDSDLVTLAREIGRDLRVSDEAGSRTQEQLGGLLDSWWADEVRHGRDRLDDAQARAAMVSHLIESEAETLLESTPVIGEHDVVDPQRRALPDELVSAFHDADGKGLDELLHDLAGYLGDDTVETVETAETVETVEIAAAVQTLEADRPVVDEDVAPADKPMLSFSGTVRTLAEPAVEADELVDDGFWASRHRLPTSTDSSEPAPMLRQVAKLVLPVLVCTLLFGLLMVFVG
jgi:hypothetical protein